MKKLTERQKETLEYIIEYRNSNGVPPAFREIAGYFGITLRAVQDRMRFISKKGLVQWENGKARTITHVHSGPDTGR
jgi:SOS-response transcriptional repressor LexA